MPTSIITPYVGSDRERIDMPVKKFPTFPFPVLLVPTFWKKGSRQGLRNW